MWVPHKEFKKKKKTKTKQTKHKRKQAELKEWQRGRDFKIFFNFFSFQIFLLRFTKTCPSEFVGINTESALRDEGYA